MQEVSKEKLRGGFYTPEPIARFILKWGLNGGSNYDILEPSCGDGVFIKCLKANNYKHVVAIEKDSTEARKASSIKLPNTTILNDDFHTYCNSTEERFNLVVGNPPYIRYQYFEKKQQFEADVIFYKAGLKYSKLTNAWVSFIVGSSLLLKEMGKIGFVIPAEILQVSYAKQLRYFLAHFYNKINIISFKNLVFPGIQQEVLLLLCEKDNSSKHHIEHLEVNDIDDLEKLNVTKLRSPKKKIDFKSNKWTFYFLEQNEIDFLEKILKQNQIKRIEDFAKVEVGITTGSNSFFTVPINKVLEYNLEDFAKPLVGRSVQVPGAIFTKDDLLLNSKIGARSYFLKFPSINKLNDNDLALQYISNGEKEGINKGYKCRIRNEWQIVPSTKISDALFIRRNNIFPKLIINEAAAYTTDTMHRVWIKDNVNLKSFVSSYYNSLSLAFTEINGRSYGGGVLELMPSEVGSILLPYNVKNDSLLPIIDEKLRNKKNIENILNFTNLKILKQNLGFSISDIKLLDGIRKKLLERRLTRGKGKNNNHLYSAISNNKN